MSFTTPFMNILKTNYDPTSSEIDTMKRILEAPTAEIRALEAQILQLQEQLDTKRTRRENLSRAIAEHQNLLTPFRSLPDDIVSEIFIACLPNGREAPMSSFWPPLVFGRVCRRWRAVALNTPRLWTSLYIMIPKSPDFYGVPRQTVSDYKKKFVHDVRGHLGRINSWLRRSKTCPLTISVHDPYTSYTSHWPEFLAKPYYALILKFSDRIHRLELDVKQQCVSDLLASVPSSSFPHLRALLLNLHRRISRYPGENWRSSGLLNAPNLTCLSIAMPPLPFQEMNINFSHLTHVVVTGSREGEVEVSDVQKIFTLCPRLCFCNIDISCSLDTLPTHTPISLPFLHTLIIVDDSLCLGELFEYADVPTLEEVSYHCKLCPSYEWNSALLLILACTNGRVKRLTTNIQFLTLLDLMECFKMTPALTDLTNINCVSGAPSSQRRFRRTLPVSRKMLSALLDLLTPAPDRPLYLPKLRVVNFDSKELNMHVRDHEILTFIRSRMVDASQRPSRSQIAALASASFVLTNDMEIDIRSLLSDYIADGLKLHLTYLGPPFCDRFMSASWLDGVLSRSPSPSPDEARYL